MENSQIILLNGAPRSGKSSIVSTLQTNTETPWMNLGVDVVVKHVTPAFMKPGIGLRPGGEHPELEEFVFRSYLALYKSIAAHAKLGFNVISDLGHHSDYTHSRSIWRECLLQLDNLPVMIVGIHCSLEDIMRRRAKSNKDYLKAAVNRAIPEPVMRWQEAVHTPGIYDLELDTSLLRAEECAEKISLHLQAHNQFEAKERIIKWFQD